VNNTGPPVLAKFEAFSDFVRMFLFLKLGHLSFFDLKKIWIQIVHLPNNTLQKESFIKGMLQPRDKTSCAHISGRTNSESQYGSRPVSYIANVWGLNPEWLGSSCVLRCSVPSATIFTMPGSLDKKKREEGSIFYLSKRLHLLPPFLFNEPGTWTTIVLSFTVLQASWKNGKKWVCILETIWKLDLL
jgi:hypothetical protein